jgi:hypothetical protein
LGATAAGQRAQVLRDTGKAMQKAQRPEAGDRLSPRHEGFGDEKGAIGWILLWALGVPIPLLLLFFLLRGCT